MYLLLSFFSNQLLAKSESFNQFSELKLVTLKDEKEITLSLIKNKRPTLLFFWASWCTYCKDVIPVLRDDVYKQFDVYPISFDDDPKKALKAWKESYSSLKEGYWLNKKTSPSYHMTIFPKVFLILPNGKVDTIYEGSQGDKLHYMANRIKYLTNQNESESN
jgi:thiol-disulfide isomerase/thioredoxin